MSADLDRKRLSQAERLEWLQRGLKMTEMITVYLSDHRGSHNYGIYCALIPLDGIDQVFSSPSWDLRWGGGMPDASVSYEGGEERVEYLRYGGTTNRVEPLVLGREFSGLYDAYMEISEEFRLFHNLYHDGKTDKYIKIDDEGNEYTVAVVEPDCVKIRLREIRQFLAIKEMYLSIQFDCIENSEYDLQELGLVPGESHHQDNLMCWVHNYCNDSSSNRRAFSTLAGKRLVEPLPKSKSGLWGFSGEPKKKHVEFIIDVDENGDEIIRTSDPDVLANYFGANPDAPHFLTPVHFDKQVLDKYYQQPSKYDVDAWSLRCGSLWHMWIDNNHNDKVCARLGHLGERLPYKEQLHWRAHNIPPKGGVSEAFFNCGIKGEAAESDRPEHLFKKRYHELQDACQEYLGWQLLLPLGTGDEYHFQGLRIPATDEQSDFDALVLSLTKILIDSLNERRLNTLISKDQKAKLKGSIARLEAVLSAHDVEGAAERIAFLRKLQSLRSSSAAHRKGRNYRKIAQDFDVESQHLRDVFTKIIQQALDVLDYFVFLVRSGPINSEIIEKNKIEEGYAILDEMVGFAKSDRTDGSVNHDEIIYELRSKP